MDNASELSQPFPMLCYQDLWTWSSKYPARDFPGGAVVKNPPASAGDTGSSPGPGRSHMPQSN